MADDVSLAKHPQYTAALDGWRTCRDLFGGSKLVKAAGERYLPRLSGQTEAEYQAYKARALFYNAFRRTVAGLTGVAFGKPPAIECPDSKIEDQLTDVTLSGEPFDSFAPGIVAEVLKVSRCGVLVDYSKDSTRPYWVRYEAESIPMWDTLAVNGDNVLTFLVLKEVEQVRDGFTVEQRERYRVCELVLPAGADQPRYQVTIWKPGTVDGKTAWVAEETKVPTRAGVALPFIPFVFFGPFGITPTIDDPPLEDLGDVLLSHYRSSADLEHGRHFTALPTPVVTGSSTTTPLKIGSSTAWVLPEQGAMAKFLEFTGQGLQSIEKACADKERMATILGSRLLESQKVAAEAATAIRMRHAGDSATLQTIVSAASLGLTWLLQVHAWWAGATDNFDDPKVSITLNNEFVGADVPIDTLSLLAQADKISFETLYFNLEKAGLTRPGITAEQEREQIVAEGGLDPQRPEPEPIVDPIEDPDAVLTP